MEHGKPSMLGGISGAVAGLVAITPASGFVKPFPALLIGFAAGVVCYLMVTTVKSKFGYDDSLDAFGVHGAGGTLGAILTGVFATNAVNDALKDAAGKPLPLGLVDGNGGQVLNQLIGSAIAWGLAIVGTHHHSQDLRHDRRLACYQGGGDPGAGPQPARRGRIYLRRLTAPRALRNRHEENRSDYPAIQARRSEGSAEEIGIDGMTISEVRGHGRQKGHKEVYRGQEYNVDLLPKVKLEMVVADDRSEEVIKTLAAAARTGKIGDGKIFVYEVAEAIRIRNDDRGDTAL